MHRRAFFAQTAAALSVLPLPEDSLFRTDPERYWEKIRQEQFVLPEWRAYLNTGSVGSAPKPVLKATAEALEKGASYAGNGYPRWGYEPLTELRSELAEFCGATREEIAITHNATESMNMAVNGLDLAPGAEIVITDQEHPSGRGPWYLRAARQRLKIREVKLPVPPERPEQISAAILEALSPDTRVLCFSGITTHTGLRLPVEEICREARQRGVVTIVDGAHMPGQVPVNLKAMGCDIFAASLHKWLLTPPGCGFLYVRQEFQDKLWPTIVVEGWDKHKDAVRYMLLGCNNLAEMEGVREALRFVKAIGVERVQARIHELARETYRQAEAIPYLELLSTRDHTMYGGMIAFQLKGKDYAPLWAKLNERKIWTLRGEKIRVSCHIHTRRRDLNLLFQTIREVYG